MHWLRLYTDITDDRKLRRLTPAQRWLWIAMMTEARKSPEPGCLMLTDGVATTPDDLADIAAVDIEEVHSGLDAFEQQKMIAWDDGVIMLLNWEKRQFESDNSTERWRRWKAKQDANDGPPVEKKQRQQSANVGSNVGPTPPEAEADTEPETETEGELAASAPAREDVDFSPEERQIISKLQQVAGLACVPERDIGLHLREVMAARDGPPLKHDVLLAEALKFRDYHQERRKSTSGKWRHWRNAVTNWFMRIGSGPRAAPTSRSRIREPDFSGIESFSRRMDELEHATDDV